MGRYYLFDEKLIDLDTLKTCKVSYDYIGDMVSRGDTFDNIEYINKGLSLSIRPQNKQIYGLVDSKFTKVSNCFIFHTSCFNRDNLKYIKENELIVFTSGTNLYVYLGGIFYEINDIDRYLYKSSFYAVYLENKTKLVFICQDKIPLTIYYYTVRYKGKIIGYGEKCDFKMAKRRIVLGGIE